MELIDIIVITAVLTLVASWLWSRLPEGKDNSMFRGSGLRISDDFSIARSRARDLSLLDRIHQEVLDEQEELRKVKMQTLAMENGTAVLEPEGSLDSTWSYHQ